jgi:hypothetical protein
MDGAVILQRDGKWPQSNRCAIEFRCCDASLHALRVLDHDLVP